MVEWIDADYSSPNCTNWTFTGGGSFDGNSEECWIRNDSNDNLTAMTTASGSEIAVHMAGDGNDGLAEIYVDGSLKATLDGYSFPTADYAQVLVQGLSHATHTVEVRATGTSTTGGGDNDVALLGTAVCVPAIKEISSAADTTVAVGLSKSELEDPETEIFGARTVENCSARQWVDADFSSPNCPNWIFTGGGSLGGNSEECWILQDSNDNLTASTTVPSTGIAVHMAGDGNDGLAEIYVDGSLKASLDGYVRSSTSGAGYAQVFVGNLSLGTHTVEVRATGTSTSGGSGDDVALLGAAACELPVATPALSELGLLGVAGLLLISGLAVLAAGLRRRRMAA